MLTDVLSAYPRIIRVLSPGPPGPPGMYRGEWTNAISRPVDDRLDEGGPYLKDFASQVGEGFETNDTDAWKKAVAWINQTGGTLKVQAGDYLYADPDYLTITKGGIRGADWRYCRMVRADGSNKFLRLGDPALAQFACIGMVLEGLMFSNADAAHSDVTNEAIQFENAFNTTVRSCFFETQRAFSIGKVASCSHIDLQNLRLLQFLCNQDLIAVAAVGVLRLINCYGFTNAASATDPGLTAGSAVALLPGISGGTQTIDTVMIEGCNFLKCYHGFRVSVQTTNSYAVNLFHTGTIFDSMKSDTIYLNDNGSGQIANIQAANSWYASFQGRGITAILNHGQSRVFHFANCHWPHTGLDGGLLQSNGTARRYITFTGGGVTASNDLAPNTGNVFRIELNGVSFSGFTFGAPFIGTAHPGKSAYGVSLKAGNEPPMLANCDFFVAVAPLDGVPTEHNTVRNVLHNGTFQIAQRGTSFANPASGSIVLDRWRLNFDGSGATRTISQEIFAVGTEPPSRSPNYLRWNETVAGSGETAKSFAQRIRSVRTFAGKWIMLGFWGKSGGADITLQAAALQQVFGTGGTPSPTVNTNTPVGFTLTSTWQQFLTRVYVPPITGMTLGTNGDDYLQLVIRMPLNQTFDIQFADVMLHEGVNLGGTDARTRFDELALCLPYFERIGGDIAQHEFGTGYADTATLLFVDVAYMPKWKTPTVTINGAVASDYEVMRAGQTVIAPSAITVPAGRTSRSRTRLNVTVASGFTAGEGFELRGKTTAGTIDIAAEL